MVHEYILKILIPHRLRAVSALTLATRYCLAWEEPKSMEIYFSGKLAIEGNSNAFTNPTIEAGLVHCRALLEFLGLCAKSGALQNVKLPRRGSDDVGVESFSNSDGPLSIVTPHEAVSRYEGSKEEAERAFLTVFHATNKGLAHFTSDIDKSKGDVQLIEIASRGVLALMVNHLYVPLGIPQPDLDIKSRPAIDG